MCAEKWKNESNCDGVSVTAMKVSDEVCEVRCLPG